jgi:hypothetical protein
MRLRHERAATVWALLVAPLLVTACSGQDDAGSASTGPTATTSHVASNTDAETQATTKAGASTAFPSTVAASSVAASSTRTPLETADAAPGSGAAATTAPTTTAAALDEPRPATTPEAAGSTTPRDSSPANPQAQASVTTNTTAVPAPSPGVATCDASGTGGYDLLDLTVERRADGLVLTVRYAPIEPGHDVWIGVTTNESTKRIVAEMFEDGSGVAQVQDLATSDTVYLDSPLEMTADHTRIGVPRQSVDAAMLSGPLTAELKVDGPSAEICSAV